MARRTQIRDTQKINRSDDLERLVKDKRSGKRANKQKATRRNRHYAKTLIKHLAKDFDSQ